MSRLELRITSSNINCILLAVTKKYACAQVQLQLKPQFSRYFTGGSEGFTRSKDLLFEDEYHGAEDQAELQGHIGEPLARSMVDALNDDRKYCMLIYNSH